LPRPADILSEGINATALDYTFKGMSKEDIADISNHYMG
jgi:hypothetical protein